MELLFRKHIKNMHTNKNTTSKTSEMTNTNNNDDEIFVDKGQGFPDFDQILTDLIRFGSMTYFGPMLVSLVKLI